MSISVHESQVILIYSVSFHFLDFFKELKWQKTNKHLEKLHEWPLLSSTVQLKYALHEDAALPSKTNCLLVSGIPVDYVGLSSTSKLPCTKDMCEKSGDEVC